MAPCFPMSSQRCWYASKDHKEWWWHTLFQNFQKKGENRKILIKMLRTIYYLANKNLSHEDIIQNKMKIWRIWPQFFQPFFFFFLKWEYYPKIFKWLGSKSNSQILMYCLILLFGDKDLTKLHSKPLHFFVPIFSHSLFFTIAGRTQVFASRGSVLPLHLQFWVILLAFHYTG